MAGSGVQSSPRGPGSGGGGHDFKKAAAEVAIVKLFSCREDISYSARHK